MLVLCDYYLPGYKAGGPIQTISNLVERLGDDYRFRIITLDRDLGDTSPYPNVETGRWMTVGKADVRYLSPRELTLGGLRRVMSSTEHDVVSINSFLSPRIAVRPLLLRRLGMLPKRPVIVAPRGELSAGALALKSPKKRLYIRAAKMLGLYRGVTWHASGEHEREDILRCFGAGARVAVAPDLPPVVRALDDAAQRRPRTPGLLRVLFLSRVCRMKNLAGALDVLAKADRSIELSVYGPIEDAGYWSECEQMISALPESVRVSYRGAVGHDEVGAVMREHDLLLLPTLGENFGHVILEALVSGTPVLISDRTPWRGLRAAGVGWDIPLDATDAYVDALRWCADADEDTYMLMSRRAREFGAKFCCDDEVVQSNRRLFEEVTEE